MKRSATARITAGLVTLAAWTFPGSIRAQEPGIVPQPGKASIVIFRAARGPAFSAGNTSYRVAFDEQPISTLPPGKYFAFPAWPGSHRIAPAIRPEQLPSSALDLEVKAGETYYIKGEPGTFKNVGTIVFVPVSKEAAQAEMSGAKPVAWMKDLQEGTLAEVRPLSPQDTSAGAECSRVEWRPDIDSVKDLSFDRLSILRGTILLRDDSLVLKLSSLSSDAEPVGITIPYADIAAVEVRNRMRLRAVVIRRKNGRLDSFAILTAGGGRVDREQTKACGEHLASKVAR